MLRVIEDSTAPARTPNTAAMLGNEKRPEKARVALRWQWQYVFFFYTFCSAGSDWSLTIDGRRFDGMGPSSQRGGAFEDPRFTVYQLTCRTSPYLRVLPRPRH